MKISTTTTGIFPKISSSKEVPSLRANLHKADRGEISQEELETIIQKNIERAVREQIGADIDLPTDGLIRWTDLFSPFVQAWDGITRRGIHRFYNTNTLYGEPVVEGELQFNSSKTLEDFKFALGVNPNVKATLPGVFTCAAACVDTFYQDEKKLCEVIAANLLEEAKALVIAGAKMIEIHEPELGWNAELKTQNEEVLEIYKKFGALDAKIIVVSYFRNFSQETTNVLVEAGCGIGIDFSQPVEIESLPEGAVLQVGLVDSRETKLEDSAILAERKAEALAKYPNSEIIFSTSSHVEYLPHEIALQKIKLLKNLK